MGAGTVFVPPWVPIALHWAWDTQGKLVQLNKTVSPLVFELYCLFSKARSRPWSH